MFYLIENNIVKEKYSNKFPIAEGDLLKWVESANANLKIGQEYDSFTNLFRPDPTITVPNLKTTKHKERKSLRDAEKFASTIVSGGKTFKTDKDTMAQLAFAAGRFNGNSTLDWYDTNDVAVTLTKAQTTELINAVYERGLDATVKSKNIKAQIDALTTVTALENFDVATEWAAL